MLCCWKPFLHIGSNLNKVTFKIDRKIRRSVEIAHQIWWDGSWDNNGQQFRHITPPKTEILIFFRIYPLFYSFLNFMKFKAIKYPYHIPETTARIRMRIEKNLLLCSSSTDTHMVAEHYIV